MTGAIPQMGLQGWGARRSFARRCRCRACWQRCDAASEAVEDEVAGRGLSLADRLMPGLAIFALKYPSLLQFEQDARGLGERTAPEIPEAPLVESTCNHERAAVPSSIATTLVGTSPLFIEYATNARGYTLTGLAFMALLLCGQGIVRRPEDPVRWGLFAVATALGMFALPLMAFPAAIATAWVVLVRWRETGAAGMRSLAVNGVVWGAVAATLTGLLYAPVLMVSGVDALFFNRAVQHGGASFPVVLANAPRSWIAWHAATPVWAQAALLLALAVGAMAPRRPSGHRGVLALAIVLGTGAVLLVKPVFLYHRHTMFLLLATMIVAGVGAACLVDAALARLQPKARLRLKAHLRSSPGAAGRRARREGLGALAVVLALGCFSWWATRPEVAEHFAWETGWSPTASALATAVDGELRSGDYVLGKFNTMHPVVFHLRRLGRDVNKVRAASAVELGLPGLRHTGRRIVMYQVGRPGSGAPARFYLVVDEAGKLGKGRPSGGGRTGTASRSTPSGTAATHRS